MQAHTGPVRITSTALGPTEAQQMIPIVVIAALSIIALLGLACRGLVISCFGSDRTEPSRETIFFRTQLGVYTGCLAVGNTLAAITGLMEGFWVTSGALKEGSTCTAQAALVVFSDFSIAWFTSVIAIHTFGSLVLRQRTPVGITTLVVVCGWLFAGLMAFVPLSTPPSKTYGPLYGNTTFICSIVRLYPLHQFFMHLLPIFLTAILSAILYSIIFLVLRGSLVMRGGVRLQLNPESRWTHRVGTGFEEYHQFLVSIAWSMLWYPLAYLACMTPTAITLLLELSGFPVSWLAMVIGTYFSQSLGVINVLLIFNTIRVLRPAMAAGSILSSSSKTKDIESFSTPEEPSEKARMTFYSTGGTSSLRPLTLSRSPVLSSAYSVTSQNSTALLIPTHQRQGSGSSFTSLGRDNPIPRPMPARQPSTSSRYSPVARAAMNQPSVNTLALAHAAYLQEAITPVAELNAQLDDPVPLRVPSPAHKRQDSSASSASLSLPPPRRTGRRSPVQRAPSIARTPTPILVPLTPAEPERAFSPSPRPESMYSLYMRRTPETPAFPTPTPERPSREPSAFGRTAPELLDVPSAVSEEKSTISAFGFV